MFVIRANILLSFNQAEDELGRADSWLTDAPSIERWWEEVMCAYTLVSLQSSSPLFVRAPCSPGSISSRRLSCEPVLASCRLG
jgi:hypothetical protein